MAGSSPAMTVSEENLTPDHLFVFGTLLSGYDHPMARRLAREADLVGKACCQGKLYLVRHYPGMVLSADPADEVHGEVFRMHDPQALLRTLDKYEGCGPGATEPTEYIRQRVSVTLDGRAIEAWTYVYNWPVTHLPRIASGKFLEH
jgi:gamma-glutamylcyclotransferase (GGCT)/AIG2-like uncharacterized protein YtfP